MEGRDLCERCYGIIRAGHTDFQARARALKAAWSPVEGRFLCGGVARGGGRRPLVHRLRAPGAGGRRWWRGRGGL